MRVVQLHRNARLLQRKRCCLRQFRCTGCGILQLVQLGGKTAEVVYGFRLHGTADGRDTRFPMRGDHQDGGWFGQLLSQFPPRRTGIARLQRQRGCTM